MYERPVLCRLCDFPVLDTGVRMADLDLAKLSRWWLQVLETELDDDDESLDNSQICQFCICDAKFRHERETENLLECDWWTGKLIKRCYDEFYLKEDVIHPCSIKINCVQKPTYLKASQTSSNNDGAHESNVKRISRTPSPTACIFCHEVFKSRRDAYRHVISSHKDKERYHCSNCLQVFKSEIEKKIHSKRYHNELRCHKCSKKMYYGKSIWDHIIDIHYTSQSSRNFVKCCNMVFKSRIDLLYHMVPRYKPKLRECIYCNKLIKSMSLHVKNKHRSVAINCYYKSCPKYFLSNKEMEHHVVEVHESRSGLAQCPYCPKKLKRAYLSGHMLLKHASIALRCPMRFCQKYFHSENERSRHILDAHAEVKIVDIFKCLYCEKQFNQEYNLNVHMNFKHASDLIICSKYRCKEYFKCEEDLKKHVQLKHANDQLMYAFNCNDCKYKSTSKELLKTHIRRAHGTEHLKCEVCSKLFTTFIAFKSHTSKAHKRTECTHCKKSLHSIINHKHVIPCIHCRKVEPCRKLQKLHRNNCSMLLDPEYLRCRICLKEFPSKEQFSYHKTHAHNKFKCVYCKKQLVRLETHLQTEPCGRCHKIAPCQTISSKHKRHKNCHLKTNS